MVNRYAVICLVFVVLAYAGCAPIRVAEVEIRLGTLIDQKSGFYAYTTSLPKNEPESLLVTYSSVVTIEGSEVVVSPDSVTVYPILGYEPRRVYVRPEYLTRKIRLDIADALVAGTVHDLGYFKKKLRFTEIAKSELDQISESEIEGLSWAILKKDNVERVRAEISRFVRYAAGYGADAVVDIAVYFEGGCASCNSAGLVIEGRVVAFLE